MNPWKGLKKLPRELWILSIAALINRSGSMVLPFMAIYANKHLHLSITDSGLILTVYGLAALVTAPIIGKICDIIHPFKVMKFSLLLSGLLLFAFPEVTSYTGILILTFVWSVLNEAFRPANLVVLSTLTSVEQRRMGFALNRLAINLGMSIGPAIGGFLILFNYSFLFYVDGAAHILSWCFLVVSALKIEYKNVPDLTEINNIIEDYDKTRSRNLIIFLLAFIPVTMVFFQMMSTFPIHLTNLLKFPEYVYGMVFTINTVMIIFIEVPLMNYLAKYENLQLISVGAILVAIGFGAMLFTYTIPVLIATVVVWTFGEMIIFPSSAAYISEIAPENKRGKFMGYYQMSNNVAFSLGPWLGTVAYERAGPSVLWSATFVLGMISYFAIRVLIKKSRSGKLSV